MLKCYNIKITGKVQDIGFRYLIEDIARIYELRGYVFNDVDNSVKMVCCAGNGIISDFLEELKLKGEKKGAVIEDITTEEIPFHIYLPPKFLRLYTDELSDISRKLDRGNEFLKDIKEDTSALPEIKGIFGSFVDEQREHNERIGEHNQWMKDHLGKVDEHNKRLEKILEKIAGK